MLDWLDPQTKALLKDAAIGQLRHGLTAMGTILASHGVLASSSDQAQFVQIGAGVVIAGAGAAWSWWQKTGKGQMQARLVDIAAAAELKRQQAAKDHVAAVEAEAKAKALLVAAQAAVPVAPGAVAPPAAPVQAQTATGAPAVSVGPLAVGA